jgi:hypothetical protein
VAVVLEVLLQACLVVLAAVVDMLELVEQAQWVKEIMAVQLSEVQVHTLAVVVVVQAQLADLLRLEH